VPGKVEAIKKLAAPTSVKQIKSFLGLVGFYRRFIKNFAKISAPLVALLSKDAEWKWEAPQQLAFEGLKQALLDAGGLYLPVTGRKYRIYTDFSAQAVSAKLHQEQVVDGKLQEVPIAFASRICRGREKHLSSAEGELLAAVFALTKYKQYVG
jgi:hypothetical protein